MAYYLAEMLGWLPMANNLFLHFVQLVGATAFSGNHLLLICFARIPAEAVASAQQIIYGSIQTLKLTLIRQCIEKQNLNKTWAHMKERLHSCKLGLCHILKRLLIPPCHQHHPTHAVIVSEQGRIIPIK